MSDEHKLLRDSERAARATEVMNNPLVQEAFAYLEGAYIQAWRQTDVHDEKSRERLFVAVNQLGKLKEHFGKVMADGRLASNELNFATKQKRFGIL